MYTDILKGNILFKGLSDDEIRSIVDRLEPRERLLKKGETALYDGDRTREFGIVLSGSLRLSHIDENGNCNLMELIEPPGSFGVMNAAGDHRLAFSAVASEPARILFMTTAPLFESTAVKDELLMRFLQNVALRMAEKAEELTRKLNDSIRRSTREKLSAYLSGESQKARSRVFTIPLNRQELADFLFVDRSAMSAELSKMKHEGLIKFNKNHFELLLELPEES